MERCFYAKGLGYYCDVEIAYAPFPCACWLQARKEAE